jgi:WD40 repeat protein
MYRNLKLCILALTCFLMLNCHVYAEDNQQLPEHLEEITLDNVDRLVPLATFSTTEIGDVIWSSDGRYLAAAAQDGIWIYHFQDLEIQSSFIKTDEPVGITFIPKRTQLIAGKTIYDAATLAIVKSRPNNLDVISPDGTLYAHAEDHSITLFDSRNNKQIRSIPIPKANCEYACYITDMAFSPDNQYLAFSSSVNDVENGIVEISTGKKVPLLLDGAWGLTYSPDGSMIAFSRGSPGRESRAGVQINNSKTGEEIGWLSIYGSFNTPAFSMDGQLLVIGGITDKAPNPDEAYGTLYFFDMSQVLPKVKLTAKDAIRSEDAAGWVNSVAFSPDYHLLATGTAFNYGPTGQVIIWGVPTD